MTSAKQASNRKSTPSTQGMTLFTRLMVSFLSFIAVLGVLPSVAKHCRGLTVLCL